MKQTSAELKRTARENLRGHYGIAIGTSITANLITSMVLMPFSFLYQFHSTNTNAVTYEIATIIISLVSVILSCGLLRIHLKIARKQAVVFSDLFYCFTRRPDRFLVEGLLIIAILLVCLLPGILCIVPGILLISVSLILTGSLLFLAGLVAAVILNLGWSMAFLLLTDDESMSALEAFRTSFCLMAGNKGRLFYIALSFLGWVLLCLLSCGIGTLWLTPYMNQTSVEFYLEITGESRQSNPSFNP